MQFTELREIYQPQVTATINGHNFTINAPTAAEGIRLRLAYANQQEHNWNTLEEINNLFGGDPIPETGIPTGGLWNDLEQANVTVDEAIHFGLTAIIYWAIGPDAALEVWNSLGKTLDATAEPKKPNKEK